MADLQSAAEGLAAAIDTFVEADPSQLADGEAVTFLHRQLARLEAAATRTSAAFDAAGRFQGLLQDVEGEPIVIGGLWALTFGNGGRAGVPDTLYFSSGPDGESHGLFGSLAPVNEDRQDNEDSQD